MRAVVAIVAVALFVCCSGCGDTHESLAGEGVATMQEMATVMEGVKDGPSAKDAKAKLTSLMEKLNKINERQAKLPTPTEAEGKAMEAKYGKQMEESSRKFQTQMFRVMGNPAIMGELGDLDQQMAKGMK